MKKIICVLLLLSAATMAMTARPKGTMTYMGKKVFQYRVFLTDKEGSPFTLKQMAQYSLGSIGDG